MKATAILVKTQSSDEYLWCSGEMNKETLTTYLKDNLGDEFAYIDQLTIETMGYKEFSVDDIFEDIYRELDLIEGA